MKKGKLKHVNSYFGWCYYAPDGNPQVRTIADTRKESRQFLEYYDKVSYKIYEEKGYTCHKIVMTLVPINA